MGNVEFNSPVDFWSTRLSTSRLERGELLARPDRKISKYIKMF